jgi:hypothetical protein
MALRIGVRINSLLVGSAHWRSFWDSIQWFSSSLSTRCTPLIINSLVGRHLDGVDFPCSGARGSLFWALTLGVAEFERYFISIALSGTGKYRSRVTLLTKVWYLSGQVFSESSQL